MVGNCFHPFSQEWDDLLNLLMDKGKICSVDIYTVTFKLKVKKKLFGFIPYTTHNYYEVWIHGTTKDTHFGYLRILNGVSNEANKSKPSQETMNLLYEKVRSYERDKLSDIYKLPEVAE